MKLTKKEILLLLIPIILFILIIIILSYLLNQKKDKTQEENIQNDAKSSPEIINTAIIEPKTSYNNPIVPNGFHKVETDTASWELDEQGNPKGWDNGLVIEDSIGNQFVWIPVKNVKQSEVNNVSKLPQGIESEHIQNQKYGGFYVARYEAGVPIEMQSINNNISEETNNINGIPVSKKGERPWNYISYDNAKANSENMYSNEYIQSGLMTIFQRNEVVSFVNKTYDIKNDISVDSANIGNYLNSNFTFTGLYSSDDGKNYSNGTNVTKSKSKGLILSTGITDRNKTYNIYDLAGNLSEMLCASSDGNINVAGRSYLNDGLTPLENIDRIVTKPNSKLGFRVVLYIK